MSEPQLERSVLEAKDREELFAIATALGTSPTPKARKPDLVGQILRATGIEGPEEAAEAKPRRTRAKKVAEPATPTLDLDGGGDPAGTAPGPGDEAGEGAETAPAGERTDGAAAVVPAERAGAVPPAGPGRATAGGVRRNPRRDIGRQAGTVGADDARSDGAAGVQRDGTGAAPAGGDRPSGRSEGPEGTPIGAGSGGAPAGARSDDADGNTNGASDDTGNHRFEEAGNRRSRRRRGRDRGDRIERDLGGQVVDQPFTGEPTPVVGHLDLRDEGYGFLRSGGHLPGPDDVYVSISQVRRFGLRRGDRIEGASRPAGGNEKYPALLRVDRVTGGDPDAARDRPRFETLVPAFPDRLLGLTGGEAPPVIGRLVELVAPIGAGQRVLLAAPPRSGRRTAVRELARAIAAANADVEVVVLVIDERPEEIAELRRSLDAEVVATSFDRPADEHVAVSELVIERAKRSAELGADVVVIFDGLTRLARAYNLAHPASGRALAGGIDTGALNPPKRFFGAARNIEGGGSLTVIATALTETGSRMDEVIFDELRDTANAEIVLSEQAAAQRVFPALDLDASTTRHEERLVEADRLERLRELRSSLRDPATGRADVAGLERLVGRIHASAGNDELLAGS